MSNDALWPSARGAFFSEPSGTVWPIYVVVDMSAEMKQTISHLNQCLVRLVEELRLAQTSSLRLHVLGLAEEPRYIASNLRQLHQALPLRTTGVASYSDMFRLLRERVSTDVASLKVQHVQVIRPVVIFITSCLPMPADTWQVPRLALSDPDWRQHPNIIAFGIGEAADARFIRCVATSPEYAFITAAGVESGHAIDTLSAAFTEWLVCVARAQLNAGAIPPIDPDGFICLARVNT